MTAQHGEQLVEGYLGRLELALHDIPDEKRNEIVEEIRGHISEAREGLTNESDADLMNLLDRLGDPADIAAAARDGQPGPRAPATNRVGWLEALALILTPFIWPAGVVLLWLSSAWTTRQKLLGTLVPPGGYPGILLALSLLQVALLQNVTVCSGYADANGRFIANSCSPPQWEQYIVGGLLIVGTLVLLLLPVAVGIYLATRLRARTPSA
jgi:hypothetical protein